MDKRSGIKVGKQIVAGGFLGNVAGSRQSVRGLMIEVQTQENYG